MYTDSSSVEWTARVCCLPDIGCASAEFRCFWEPHSPQVTFLLCCIPSPLSAMFRFHYVSPLSPLPSLIACATHIHPCHNTACCCTLSSSYVRIYTHFHSLFSSCVLCSLLCSGPACVSYSGWNNRCSAGQAQGWLPYHTLWADVRCQCMVHCNPRHRCVCVCVCACVRVSQVEWFFDSSLKHAFDQDALISFRAKVAVVVLCVCMCMLRILLYCCW